MTARTETLKRKMKTVDKSAYLGRWRNQHGSELNIVDIEVDPSGYELRGTFKTGVGAHDPEEEFPVWGFLSKKLITFSVNFSRHGCLTAWTGQYRDDGKEPVLETLWHLTRELPEKGGDEKDRVWTGIWTGADTFCRVKKEDGHRDLTLFDRPVSAPSYPFKTSLK